MKNERERAKVAKRILKRFQDKYGFEYSKEPINGFYGTPMGTFKRIKLNINQDEVPGEQQHKKP